jgi:cytoskeletal protein RodZ
MELKPDLKLSDSVQAENLTVAKNSIVVSPATETTVESGSLNLDHQSLNEPQNASLENQKYKNEQSPITHQNYDDVSHISPQSVSLGSSMSTSSLPLSQTQNSSNAQRPGERLRQARLFKGREIKDISTDLNINERILIAIEADDYKLLPEPAFIRGYLRAYGRLLGIDCDSLILQFNEIYTSATGLSSNHSLENSPLQQLAKLQSRTRRSKRWMLWFLVPIVLVLIVLILRPVVKHIMGTTNDTAAQSVGLTDTQTVNIPTSTAPITTLQPATTSQNMSDQLVLTLSKPSDINVQDSTGKTLVSGLQATTQPLTLDGQSPFSITLADAAHVSLSLNGEHVDLGPYTVDGHASFRLSR